MLCKQLLVEKKDKGLGGKAIGVGKSTNQINKNEREKSKGEA
jgi:hypothetical protein